MKMDAPRISRELPRKGFKEIFYEEDFSLETCEVVDSVFDNEVIDKIRLYDVVIKDCSFIQTDFGRADMTDVIFDGCNLSNAVLRKSSIHRVVFRNCKLVGVDFSESGFGNVGIEDSVLNLAAFGESKLEKVIFKNTALKGTDYFNCKLKNVEFQECLLDGANFSDTSLKGIDIRTSTFDELLVDLKDLRGCKVSSYQAIQFASLMGLVIKD